MSTKWESHLKKELECIIVSIPNPFAFFRLRIGTRPFRGSTYLDCHPNSRAKAPERGEIMIGWNRWIRNYLYGLPSCSFLLADFAKLSISVGPQAHLTLHIPKPKIERGHLPPQYTCEFDYWHWNTLSVIFWTLITSSSCSHGERKIDGKYWVLLSHF